MSALSGQVGELGMTLQITRKATGKTEEYQLTGFVDEEKLQALLAQDLLPANTNTTNTNTTNTKEI